MKKNISLLHILIQRKIYPIKTWIINFKNQHPHRFYGSFLFVSLLVLTVIFRTYVTELLFTRISNMTVQANYDNPNQIEKVAVEEWVSNHTNTNVQGIYTKSRIKKIRSDVGFADLRVLTLEDFFNHYGSPLAEHSDEFIEASEKYEVKNWQLLPAIGLAETVGCQTGTSYEQRNCWGWGGSGENRWEFDTFADAIDTITYLMISGYSNDRMNAKDIQNTYCGLTCAEWGWRWARGVNYYTFRINDFGEKYGLERTNEIHSFND